MNDHQDEEGNVDRRPKQDQPRDHGEEADSAPVEPEQALEGRRRQRAVRVLLQRPEP